MPLRGPYIIQKRSRFLWHLAGVHYFQRHRFPGSLVWYNLPRRKKKKKKRCERCGFCGGGSR